MKRIYAIFGILLLCWCFDIRQAMAQQKVTGKITAASDNTALPGVSVLVKGTSTGTTADANGMFSIVAPANATLVFSFIGYKTIEVAVGGKVIVNASLQVSDNKLDEVVVVGYGTVKKSDLTGSVGSVSTKAIKEMPITSSEQALQGRVAGVQVTQGNAAPGGGVSVRIRGGNSVLGGNEPLYVIDGFPIYNGQSSDVSQNQPANGLASINPNDIVSMEVLKDASATAIYGARGANGVVIITTKRGKSGQGQIDFDAYTGVQVVSNKLDMLNSNEFMDLANERARNLGTSQPFTDKSRWTANTDWQDVMFRNAPMKNYSLTFSGGNERNRYAVSGNWFDQEGIVLNSGYKRGSFRVNLDNQLSEKISLSTSITASRSINNQARTTIFTTNGIVFSTIIAPPVAPTKNDNGTYYTIGNVPTADPAWNNPLAQAEKSVNRLEDNRILANTNLSYAITPDLSFAVRLGGDFNFSEYNRFLGKELVDGSPGGKASVSRSSGSSFLNENIVTYKKLVGKAHDLNVTAGYTWQKFTSSSLTSGAENFAVDLFQTNNLGSGNVQLASSTNRGESTLLSWLGRVNYTYKGKYLVTLSARADGSSRFGNNNKWGYFPSAALAWRVSEEQFIKNISAISDFKIRASYGKTGNQEIGSYQSLSRLSNVVAIVGTGQTGAIGFAPTAIANPNLKWETTTQYDMGIDIGLWNDRLKMTADYYFKNTTDLLAQVPLPLSSGFTSIILNSGNISNQGFELSLDGLIIDKPNLKWTLGGNLSTNKNTVVDVAVASGRFFAPAATNNVSVNIIQEGYPLSSFWGYVRDGLWEADQGSTSLMPNAKAGDQKYKDLNGDGRINDEDRTILGNPTPDLLYGLNSNLKFGNFDLSLLVQGVSGNKIFNANRYNITDNFARGSNQLREVLDRWTPEDRNLNARYPRTSNITPLFSDMFFENGAFVRLKNIVLSYSLPVSKLNLKFIRSARIYVSGQNLLTLTDYSGFDPEVSTTGSSDLRKGLDLGAYPYSKSYNLGINIGL